MVNDKLDKPIQKPESVLLLARIMVKVLENKAFDQFGEPDADDFTNNNIITQSQDGEICQLMPNISTFTGSLFTSDAATLEIEE